MSAINTNGINVNYPVPGVNNNSQGFRDNFASIKNNLNTAGTEITDLQNKVVVKQALANTVINNDMANTLISNAAVRSFRSTMYNLGGSLSGVVNVNASLGDVQFGTVSANTTLQFGNWPPTGTQGKIEIQLSVSNTNAYITFPSELIYNGDLGASTVENASNVGGNLVITVPNNVTQLNYVISTVDCGNTLYITPVNRPRQTTQIQQRSPAPTGFQGDVAGTIAVDTNYLYVCTATFDSGGANTIVKTATTTTASTDEVVLSNVTSLVVDAPIIFTGTTFGNIVANTVYYIKTIVGGNNAVTLSDTRTGGTAGSTFALADASGTCTATSYNGSDIWKKISLTSW